MEGRELNQSEGLNYSIQPYSTSLMTFNQSDVEQSPTGLDLSLANAVVSSTNSTRRCSYLLCGSLGNMLPEAVVESCRVIYCMGDKWWQRVTNQSRWKKKICGHLPEHWGLVAGALGLQLGNFLAPRVSQKVFEWSMLFFLVPWHNLGNPCVFERWRRWRLHTSNPKPCDHGLRETSDNMRWSLHSWCWASYKARLPSIYWISANIDIEWYRDLSNARLSKGRNEHEMFDAVNAGQLLVDLPFGFSNLYQSFNNKATSKFGKLKRNAMRRAWLLCFFKSFT